MAVKTEQVEKNLVKLTFEISREDFEKAIDTAFAKNKNRITLPGFRKGKAPKSLIFKEYGEEAFYEDALNEALPEAYVKALDESGLEPVARPDIEVGEINKGEAIEITALVTTKPEVKLGKYLGIKTEKIEYTVSEEDIDKDIEATQKKNGRLITVEDRAVENGDIANIDFEGFKDGVAFEGGKGEGYDLEIGSHSFIEGFEEQLIGMKAGDETEINVKFPEEYHSEELKGQPATFKVKINEIKTREYPELDDDFASEVSEFETMAEYRASVKERLEKQAEDKAKTETENAIVEKVTEAAEIDIPAAMIEGQIDVMVNDFAQRLAYQGMNIEMYLQYMGSTMEAFRENFKVQAEKQVRTTLVLEAIAKAEGVEATAEETDEKLAEMGKIYNMELDKLKEALGEEGLKNVEHDIAMGKTIDMLVNKATVK